MALENVYGPEDNVFVMDHPLIQHKISLIRDKETGTNEFRKIIEEIDRTLYTVTGSYEGTEMLDQKLSRIMLHNLEES